LGSPARAGPHVEVLIQGADPLEYTDILAAIQGAQKIDDGPFSFWVGSLSGHAVALSFTGEALLNSVTATVLGIQDFTPDLVINQGTSGAQVPGLAVHDIVVGARAVDYGGFASAPRASGEGCSPISWTPLVQVLRDPKSGALVPYPQGFAGDPEALTLALKTPNSMGRVISGVIGSAQQINLELDRVAWTHKTFGMDVEEMESGPVAAIARAFGVRYIAFRVVSDAPYARIRFQESAAKATSLFTIAYLKNLPALP
jgi:adenosylhomocysteine nucleosidase